MQFPNALLGVKRIYRAEIIALIGAVVGVVAAIMSFVSIFSGGNSSLAGFVGAGVLLIAMAVLLFIAFIMNLVGLNTAKPDEVNFKNALIAVVVGILASILLGFAKEGTVLKELGETVSNICNFLSTYFVCTAIINLANTLNNNDMANRGLSARKAVMAVWIITIVLDIAGAGFTAASGNNTIAIIATVIGIAAAIFEIVAYILYLKLLSRARTMLEA
jgi:drug/metabolite transporter (DMT)-like permease